jgi:glycosyltransferase involved in cell wall biosynthesis
VLVNGVAATHCGAATYLQSQIEELGRLKSLRVTVYAPEEVARRIARRTSSVVVRPVRKLPLIRRLLWEQAVLPFLARSCDVIYLPGNFALFAANRPQVVALQNPHHFGSRARHVVHDRYPTLLRTRLLLERFAARASVRRGTRIVAISHSIKACVEEDLGRRRNLDVVLSATPVLPEGKRTSEQARYALVVAYDYFHKDWDRLAMTFASDASLPPLKVVGGWRGEERLRRLKRMLDRCGDARRVDFVGPVTDQQTLADLYAGACCFIAHSHLEAFPLTPYEAMAQGVPVVASDIPAHREVCGEHATYYAIDDVAALKDAVRRAVTSCRQEQPSVLLRTWRENALDLAAVLHHAVRTHRHRRGAPRIGAVIEKGAGTLHRLPWTAREGR